MPEEQKLEIENPEFCRRQAIGTCEEYDYDPLQSEQNIQFYLDEFEKRLSQAEFEDYHREQFEKIYAKEPADKKLFPIVYLCIAEINSFHDELSGSLQWRGEGYEYCEAVCRFLKESSVQLTLSDIYLDGSYFIGISEPNNKEYARARVTKDLFKEFEKYIRGVIEKVHHTITVNMLLQDSLRTQFADIVESISDELKLPTLKDWEQGNL